MFSTRSGCFAIFINTVLAILLFLLFVWFGWITILSSAPMWQILLVTMLVNILSQVLIGLGIILVSAVSGFLADIFDELGLDALRNLVLGFLVVVILGTFAFGPWGVLALTGSITGLFTIVGFGFRALVIGLAFLLIRFNTKSW